MGRWAGQTVVVAASGPSLLPSDLTAVQGRWPVVVVNATFLAAPWADVLYASDWRFWRTYRKRIEGKFSGERWSISRLAEREMGVHRLEVARTKGLDHRWLGIGGTNSGHQAVNLAAFWGANRILLLGFDMQMTDGQHHWHGKHLGQLPNGEAFPEWIEHMCILAKDLKRAGIQVVNCSRATALRCFPRATIEEALHGEDSETVRHAAGQGRREEDEDPDRRGCGRGQEISEAG